MNKAVRLWIAGLAVGSAILCGAMAVIAADAEPWKASARDARKKNPVAMSDSSVAAGKVVYVKECLSCHGTAGKGDGTAAKDLNPKPGDLSAAKMWDQTDGELFWKVTTGRKPMPTFETTLSDDQRWNVVNYARTLAPKPATTGEAKGDSK